MKQNAKSQKPKDEIFKDSARDPKDWKTKERVKSSGEVFTPPELINQMLDQVDTSLFQPGKTFLEPSAGTGNMVIEYLKRKLEHGCTPTEALQDTFVVEYMEDNLEAMRKRVLELCGRTPEHEAIVNEQIVHANFLDELDTEDGRRYPKWLRSQMSIEDFFE